MKNKKLLIAIVILTVFIMIAINFNVFYSNSSNSSTKPDSTGNAPTGTLYLSPGPSPAFTDNFNPFNIWSSPAGIMSLLYEPLFQINTYNGTTIPWLATNYTWSHNNTLLTLNLRHNVQFSNGMPFNSSDVVFTFNTQKNVSGQWSNINHISAVNKYTVNFNFSKPDVQCLFYLGSNFMLPEPLWKGVSNPASKVIKTPVGTGPYTLSSFSGQKIVLTANPNYWQPNEPHIKNVVYIDYTSSSALTLALAEGKIQWTSAFAPNVTQLFVQNNPKANHYWFPPGQPVTLITNDAIYPFNLSYFRQAISLSINRTKICNVGEYGYEKPANAANILQQQLFWLNSTNANLAKELAAYNTTKALKLLTSHGFTMTKGRLYEPNGTKLPGITLMSVAGYTDWDADISIIASELAHIGIKVTTETPTQSGLSSDIATGNFQMAQDTVTGIGPNPWYDYTGLIGPVTPIDKTTGVNEERWNYTNTNFMSSYNNFTKTSNTTEQKTLINNMASIMLNQMPMIPLVYSADFYEYVNSSIGGFPNQSNHYWIPMPWYPGPMEVVELHLYAKSNSAATTNYSDYYIVGGLIAIAAVAGISSIYIKRRRAKDN